MNFVKSFFRNTDIKQEYNKEINIQNQYPKEWLDIHYKFYPRFSSIPLNKRLDKKNLLYKSILSRRSFREFDKEYKINKEQISELFYITNKIKNKNGTSLNSRRAYPSAGARFPIEQYLVVFNSSDFNEGVYHYNVYDHSLEILREEDTKDFFKEICNSDWVSNASSLIILTSIPLRTCIKYNQRGLRYVLFEIGHIAQNIMLIADNLGLHTCAIGGFDDKKLARFLKCDKVEEYPLYLISLGK